MRKPSYIVVGADAYQEFKSLEDAIHCAKTDYDLENPDNVMQVIAIIGRVKAKVTTKVELYEKA